MLGPVAVVAVAIVAHESAVTTVAGDDGGHFRIAGHLGPAELVAGHERVVVGRQDQRRHRDPIDDTHRAGAMVIVGGVAEAMVGRGVGLVELADRADLARAVRS